ncbi:MAG TPA: sigma-70 family RNA polymerase sigma factor [Phycisphaerales bacterium]|nr:sigma-70 family RNA polymerase sigma factor [Phycisphaerales bacterium]
MKIRIHHPALRELFDQFRFAPTRQQHKYMAAAEKLMLIIDPEQEYPYEFIVYRITGFRPTGFKYEDCLIAGRELLADLRVWLSQVSGRLEVPTAMQQEPIFTVEALAERFSVSEKTIRRWEKRGLTGRIYVFEDGKKRKGYAESAVLQFEREHRDLVTRSARFTKLNQAEKETIYQWARRLAGSPQPLRSRNELLKRLSERTGRARETLRIVLEQMEQQHGPCDALPASRGRLSAREAAQIYKLRRQGVRMCELSERFNKSRSSLYRIINQHRARELLNRKIDYIDSPAFIAEDAETRLLEPPLETLLADSKDGGGLLTRTQESALFCRYNFLKCLAARERAKLRPKQPAVARLRRIETLLEQADCVKQHIIGANMPLVISIAGRHLSAGLTINELIGEGTLSLMAAVEKFDYTRGYRFSTYAGWAIAKDFARKIPAEAHRPDRAGGSDVAGLPHDFRLGNLPDIAAVEQAQHDLISVINSNLDPRERFIILNHYPLDTGVIKKKPMTLKQIGDELGLTKERVRQIELQALQKLRHSLSPEQFDLLTG